LLKEVAEDVKLTSREKMIAEARGNGPSFDDMDASAREVACDEIMLRIASICGCALPNTDFFARYISDEIESFVMNFGFSDYTLDEIILAFRINAANVEGIVFTGVCVNTAFIAKVLNYYSESRKMLENKLKNKIDGYEI
jgi:hypothetical protein